MYPVTELFRPALSHYPFQRGKSFVTRLLRFEPSEIPEGRILSTKYGVNVRMHPDEMYSRLYLFQEYEPANTEIYKALVREGDIVFDVGANFGWFTAILGHEVGKTGKVYCFEPVPSIAAMTLDTIRMNALEEVAVLNNFGLGSAGGSFTVYTFKGLPLGHATATDLGRSDAVPHTCKISTLDTFMAESQLDHIDFMKIDVEGHELEVFKGGSQTLSSPDAPVVVFEINRACLESRSIEPKALVEQLRKYGYTHFWRINGFGGVTELQDGINEENADYIGVKGKRLQYAQEVLRGF
jgi:FkbM family methyltransferase